MEIPLISFQPVTRKHVYFPRSFNPRERLQKCPFCGAVGVRWKFQRPTRPFYSLKVKWVKKAQKGIQIELKGCFRMIPFLSLFSHNEKTDSFKPLFEAVFRLCGSFCSLHPCQILYNHIGTCFTLPTFYILHFQLFLKEQNTFDIFGKFKPMIFMIKYNFSLSILTFTTDKSNISASQGRNHP